MQELRAAVIGLGFGRRHIQAYQRLPGVRVVAIAARNADRLEQARREYGIPAAYTDDAQLYEHEDLDLVSICTPDRLHAEQALRALHASVPVLCEKPIATSLKEAARLVQAVRETGRAFMAGHNYRFVPQFARLKALVESDAAGDLLLAESCYVQDLYAMEALGAGYWRWADPQEFYLGGAIHNVDLLRWVMGEVREVHSYATRGMPFYALDDTYVSNFVFESGSIGRLLLVLGHADVEVHAAHAGRGHVVHGEVARAQLPANAYGGRVREEAHRDTGRVRAQMPHRIGHDALGRCGEAVEGRGGVRPALALDGQLPDIHPGGVLGPDLFGSEGKDNRGGDHQQQVGD